MPQTNPAYILKENKKLYNMNTKKCFIFYSAGNIYYAIVQKLAYFKFGLITLQPY